MSIEQPPASEKVPQQQAPKHQPMEFIVLLAFLGTWIYTKDAITATIVLTLGSVLHLCMLLYSKTPITKMQKTMFVAIFLGGGLTIVFQNPEFLKWKLTIVNAGFTGALIIMHYLGKAPIKTLMSSMTNAQDLKIEMPDSAWNQLTFIFAGFFGIIAITNTYITLFMDFNAWVWFKSGIFGISMVFFPIVLTVYLMKYKAFQASPQEVASKPENDEVDA